MAGDILKTDRLVLREITPADLPFLHRIFSDAESMRYYPGIKSFDETALWFQRLAFDSYASHGFGLWAVTDRQSGALLGDCGITMQETSAGLEPEIGYHLWRDHWGKGYAVEAATACRDHALDTFSLARIVSIVRPDNTPSRRVAERVHRRRETFAKTGSPDGGMMEFYLYITDAA
ncbi:MULTISPECIES: GNAT family N-acetyltransferase [Rhizobium]|jgi:ribosomal-protein-alanine N-acetyltransferase|uniref:N-acetyltransferase n=1 Tax=Rhizobium anhuiense TaxID=1184720 RepID=A0ABX4JAS8_9HYPH|nr:MULTISPECIES: GNAT family N-acetyltransferase [Rhizobium]KZS49858.1 acetyltransferase [Rhizobium anhuiense bv. trifolii]MBB3298164.1 RimJ/RimL family protein N-acetyltransferase [Rhizobium sp. BK112]MBB3366531.1 RimJ/RimL family protein N-acetyltransferase [Rhizobium sp. BK077]MBB3745906.1 RimJ/RimL family protein N-acetyltransferase [Rhizobium sp. BK591]MBB4177342.1 RimJ/RimL family protein N-acetyltransferase [Rhizobium sp. BK109]